MIKISKNTNLCHMKGEILILVFANKVLLEYRHSCFLCIVYDWLLQMSFIEDQPFPSEIQIIFVIIQVAFYSWIYFWTSVPLVSWSLVVPVLCSLIIVAFSKSQYLLV